MSTTGNPRNSATVLPPKSKNRGRKHRRRTNRTEKGPVPEKIVTEVTEQVTTHANKEPSAEPNKKIIIVNRRSPEAIARAAEKKAAEKKAAEKAAAAEAAAAANAANAANAPANAPAAATAAAPAAAAAAAAQPQAAAAAAAAPAPEVAAEGPPTAPAPAPVENAAPAPVENAAPAPAPAPAAKQPITPAPVHEQANTHKHAQIPQNNTNLFENIIKHFRSKLDAKQWLTQQNTIDEILQNINKNINEFNSIKDISITNNENIQTILKQYYDYAETIDFLTTKYNFDVNKIKSYLLEPKN
jgi:hypothetical protein